MCSVTTADVGKVKFCFYLAVPAKFVTAEQNYTARLGEAVALDCLSEGDRPLSIAWSFNHGHIDWQYNTRCVSGRGLVESALHLVMQNRCYYTTFLVMAALRIADADIIFLPCGFYLLSFSSFPRLLSAVADWMMSTILAHMVWP